MKAALTSIQPYYVFLIIAPTMGWDIPQEKTVEVRKDYPKDRAWNKVVLIYCSKNRKSFNRIPTQYQPFMEKLLGKVIGEFVCDKIDEYPKHKAHGDKLAKEVCLKPYELTQYSDHYTKTLYGLHISNLKIYDKPKALGEFKKLCDWNYDCNTCKRALYEHKTNCFYSDLEFAGCDNEITRPPQSWCYVDG